MFSNKEFSIIVSLLKPTKEIIPLLYIKFLYKYNKHITKIIWSIFLNSVGDVLRPSSTHDTTLFWCQNHVIHKIHYNPLTPWFSKESFYDIMWINLFVNKNKDIIRIIKENHTKFDVTLSIWYKFYGHFDITLRLLLHYSLQYTTFREKISNWWLV